MPIRPENRHRYPPDWPDISLAAKEAAGWQCACEGECGRGTHKDRCPNVHGQPAYGTGSTVVLTTAHLNHQPEDCRPDNLRPMCQGCHLHYDREHHRETAAATRRARIEAAGQLALGAETAAGACTDPADGADTACDSPAGDAAPAPAPPPFPGGGAGVTPATSPPAGR